MLYERRRALRGVFFRLLFACAAGVATLAHGAEPRHFLFVDSDDLHRLSPLIERPDIEGVQIVYSWRSLESSPDRYDFSRIEADLAFLEKRGKKLFAQIQDRFFEIGARNVPAYLLEDPVYAGGLAPQRDNPGEDQPEGHGWVAMQWKPAVRARFQALLHALGKQFDGRLYGVNLPESAADIDREHDQTGFDCDRYFDAELDNAKAARAAFRKSYVVQYVNFWPCEWNDERHYMSRAFEFAAREHIGIGGPDIVPWRAAHMNNAYPFLNRYRGKLPLVAMAVQEPTLTYRNPQTGKPFTREEFVAFARDYLGVDIIFWSARSPWLTNTEGALSARP